MSFMISIWDCVEAQRSGATSNAFNVLLIRLKIKFNKIIIIATNINR